MTISEKKIEKIVDKRVNGGIRDLRLAFDNYVKEDMQWKKDNQPSLDNMKNITITTKTLLKFSLLLGGLGVILTFIKKFTWFN